MRHRKAVFKLGRTAAHRKATLANLAIALFDKKHIKTTEAKAKAARQYSERLVTLAKSGTLHARRIAFQRLHDKKAVHVLFDEIAPRYHERNGGYTRIVKLGQRPGDGASMAILELVGYEMAKKKKKEKDAAKEDKKKKSKKSEEVKDQDTEDKISETKKVKKKTESEKTDKDKKKKKKE